MVHEKSKTPTDSKRFQNTITVLYANFFNRSGLVDQIHIQRGRPTTGCVYKDKVFKNN